MSEEKLPVIAINAQYVKDLSFENPNSPASLKPEGQPKIDLALDLEAKIIDEDLYEVVVNIHAKAQSEEKQIFIADLAYGGLFTIKNVDDAQKELILLIHCPTILFPFARRIIADATRDGGFQPLMIDPIDFAGLYQQRKLQEEKESAKAN